MQLLLPDPFNWSWDGYTDHARIFNAILLAGVVACMTANMLVRRPKTNRRTRRIGLWLFLFMVNGVYGYSITIREHRPYNHAVGIATLILIGTLGAFIWHPDGDDLPPPNDGSLGTRAMDWLDHKVRIYKTRHSEKE